ncbi:MULTISPECIES: hypothetical protein [Stenotrophomonas]|uniref:hypothetical protein n=1 Tax=Stenotrophomonas TaxID=40323 RepID=UPI0008DDB756|nr:hypothetical protein [Stenotrophomonas maltophilia]OHY71841.1 hypothetical protein BB780_00065 [Stenotrophomonas maltophilia]HDS1836834.1 hypothetical protein [Stenotrophomonas maltophilia]HEL4844066.1 hypothetical protein [Stenotrophomonas maltophilia]
MLDEVIKSAREYFLDRVASPLTGAFVLSWCIWNYKFILIILSDEHVVRKLHLVRAIIFPDWTATAIQGFAAPLATALIYLFLYPRPARLVYEHTLKERRRTTETKRKVENEDVLTVGDSQRLREQYAQRQIAHRAEISKLTANIESQEDQIKLLADRAEKAVQELAEARVASDPEGRLAAFDAAEMFNLEHELAIANGKIEELQSQIDSASSQRSQEGLFDEWSSEEKPSPPSNFTWPHPDSRVYHAMRRALQKLAESEYLVFPSDYNKEAGISIGFARYIFDLLADAHLATWEATNSEGDSKGFRISPNGIEVLLSEGWTGASRAV